MEGRSPIERALVEDAAASPDQVSQETRVVLQSHLVYDCVPLFPQPKLDFGQRWSQLRFVALAFTLIFDLFFLFLVISSVYLLVFFKRRWDASIGGHISMIPWPYPTFSLTLTVSSSVTPEWPCDDGDDLILRLVQRG